MPFPYPIQQKNISNRYLFCFSHHLHVAPSVSEKDTDGDDSLLDATDLETYRLEII
ncbi:hypothetical protein [Pseudescherichia sp.]|uniref:hypothetical protein n=1 Tax=Pseudescherichia sp. TaxID=2055881 RepID=UPI00289F4F8C|nr:hypothetical protein [Pseudescherichia sp.]